MAQNIDFLKEFVNIVLEYLSNPIIQANIQQIPHLKEQLEQKIITTELAECMTALNSTTQKAISVLSLLEKESTKPTVN
jgi:hypothetical protein